MKEKKYYGKEKCRILKQIRAEIAKQNDIAWVVEECSHKGNCRGTCPKCEAEVRQLEKALERRAALGKTVAVVGISAGLSLSVTGCLDVVKSTAGEPTPPPGGEIYHEETTATTTTSNTAELYTEMVEGEFIPVPGEEPLPETETETQATTDTETDQETVEELMSEPVEYEPIPGDETEPAFPELMGMVILPSDDDTQD